MRSRNSSARLDEEEAKAELEASRNL